jgi:hypothetical protein
MRSFYIGLVMLCFAISAQAKIHTVSNRVGTTADFVTIIDAVAAASVGDTVYVQGSETAYAGFTVNKRLVIFGPGHHPSKQFALRAYINGTVNLGAGLLSAGGSVIMGLDIAAITSSVAGSNITLKRCKIGTLTIYGGTAALTNWVIESNIISNLAFYNGNYPFNFMIQNNIIDGRVTGGTGLFFTNNVFYGRGTGAVAVTNSTIQNNIFFVIAPTGATNSTFNNNITYKTGSNELPYGNNIGSGNIVNTDPQFINVNMDGGPFSYDFDFHLKPTSPALGQGINGQDIGVYGGAGFSETGEPPIPKVSEFIIKNGVVAPGGKLSISVKAEAKN